MPRSFTSRDLIALPLLNATEAAVLATELLTVADARAEEIKGKELPAPITRAKGRLAVAKTALEKATLPHTGEGDKLAKRKRDRALDNAWSATIDWLGGWCKLPPEQNPHQAEAKELFALVFADALQFTKLAYKLEWKESQARLDAIAATKHDKTFKKLGGEAFLAHLKEAHEAYGRVLHITAPKPDDGATADVRAAFLAVLGALRDYAAKAAAHADPDVPGSEALSEALLKPLAAWESRRATARDADDEADTETNAGAAAEPQQDAAPAP